jgi:anti-sigma regulatory factor (Ser/Thr protein kinase)
VAQEQAALRGSIAEMFVNVARRDQVLLNRQLSFIDSLERTEEDPQALANLFRLDHLATRMRRNAESLLVLAGIDSGRRLRDALPLSDVVRTASSEIEQYDRVELDLQADPHMLGFNALPAAHLLAEVLENATVFSEPETPVVVTTAVAGAFVEVRVADEGLGMSEAELAAANEKIAATSASDALGAQRLGLFVVGRLAQRLGAEVRLRKNTRGSTGTETVVRFPATLFQSTESSPLGVYGDTATAAQPAAPVVAEVDLAALTEGVTDQGLPRRRAALPARPARGGFDEDSIVLPDVTASPLSAELSEAGNDWAPLVVPDQNRLSTANGSELPSRQPAPSASGAPAANGAGRIPAVPDPATRAGMFAGFRGRIDRPAAPAPAEPAEPEVPALVVPGLAPEEDWAPGQVAASFWTLEEPAASAATDQAPTWSSGATSERAHDEFVPASFAPETPTASAPLFERPAAQPWSQPEVPAPDEPVVADAEPPGPAVPVPAAPVADEPGVELWTPPVVDLAQWAIPVADAPAFEPQPDAFSGLSGWNAAQGSDTGEDAPYAPFGRSLDEAQAWATGAVPVVPEPVGFPGSEPEPVATTSRTGSDSGSGSDDDLVESSAWSDWNADGEPWSVPLLEEDGVGTHGATNGVSNGVTNGVASLLPPVVEEPTDAPAAAAAEAFVPEPADVAEPIDLPVTPAWAPTPPTESFHDLVHQGDEGHARRRGWFGRRKEHTVPTPPPAPVAPTPPPVAIPATPVVAPVPALPVRSSAWAPAASPVPEPFPRREPAPAPAAAAPAPAAPVEPAPVPAVPVVAAPQAPASSSWAPQATWTPPVATTLPDGSAARGGWSASDWSAAHTPATGPVPAAGGASGPPEHSSGPRIGTLDDEVAAMLALRSDIQEQALSELSQLSAYRPQVVANSDRLTRRVPTAVPEAPEIVESTAERDPDEVRSRLASFQSGTARGRRDAGRDEETS